MTPPLDRCYLCRCWVGNGPDLMPSVLVDFDGRLEEVCDLCMERAEPELHPDYTEDLNPEGDPVLNGAYG